MAAAVTLGLRRDRVPDRLPGGALCRPARQGAVLSRRDAAALVELSGPRLCLEADPGQGGRRQLAGAGDRARLAARRRPGAAGGRRPVAVGLLSRHVPGVHLHLAAVHDPAGAGGPRARAGLAARGRGRSRRPAAADLPHRDPAAGLPRRRRRLDLHLLADAGRLHHPLHRRHVAACSSARRSTCSRAPPATSRWRRPSRSCRS